MSRGTGHRLVVSTAPLRISLAGGGTDLPGYAGRKGGVVVGAATDLAITVIRRCDTGDGVRTCLENRHSTDGPDAIGNPFAREGLRRHWDGRPAQITSFGDVPGGSGLGSSAAFCVALVAALRGGGDPLDIAERAGEIETAGLSRPVGKQDHYLSALGGFQVLRFARDGGVRAEPLEVAPATVRDLDNELLLFFTGLVRDAGTILAAQHERMCRDDRDVERRLDEIKDLTSAAAGALTRGDVPALGAVLARHWELKRGLSPRVSPPRVEAAYADARAAGATGGKLVGAGGGGHLLLHVPREHQDRVRSVLAGHHCTERLFTLGGPGLLCDTI